MNLMNLITWTNLLCKVFYYDLIMNIWVERRYLIEYHNPISASEHADGRASELLSQRRGPNSRLTGYTIAVLLQLLTFGWKF